MTTAIVLSLVAIVLSVALLPLIIIVYKKKNSEIEKIITSLELTQQRLDVHMTMIKDLRSNIRTVYEYANNVGESTLTKASSVTENRILELVMQLRGHMLFPIPFYKSDIVEQRAGQFARGIISIMTSNQVNDFILVFSGTQEDQHAAELIISHLKESIVAKSFFYISSIERSEEPDSAANGVFPVKRIVISRR